MHIFFCRILGSSAVVVMSLLVYFAYLAALAQYYQIVDWYGIQLKLNIQYL